jgi:hypothetical protein
MITQRDGGDYEGEKMSIHINLSFEKPTEAEAYLKALAEVHTQAPDEDLARWEDDGGAPARESGIPPGFEDLPAGVKRRIFFRETYRKCSHSEWPFEVTASNADPEEEGEIYEKVVILPPHPVRLCYDKVTRNIWIETAARLLVKE